jgi:hypothetical protein
MKISPTQKGLKITDNKDIFKSFKGGKMITVRIKRALILLGIICFALVFLSSEAFPWNYATHAYIDSQLGKNIRPMNLDEIYGGMAPDIFNYMFDNPEYLGYLSYQTHDGFMNVWKEARTKREKAFGYGFVSHNDVWGADSTAHHSGITYGQAEGYVIEKAYILKQILDQIPEYHALDLPDDVSLEVSHNLIENGVDILIKRLDSRIGEKIIHSSLFRSARFPDLLVKTYAGDFSAYAGISYPEAAYLIKTAEKEFRESLIFYGQALLQDDETAIQLISQQTAYIADSFLGAYGITLPEGTDLTPLIIFAIQQSIELCADDFADEIEATINQVDQQLNANGINY